MPHLVVLPPLRKTVRTDAGDFLQEAGPLRTMEGLFGAGGPGPPEPVHIHLAPCLSLGGLLQVAAERAERRQVEGHGQQQVRSALQPLVLR